MDEMKWAWVLFVAATLALLIRLAMWFLPAPGWREEKVVRAAAEAPEEMPAEPFAAEPEPEPELPAVSELESADRLEWVPPLQVAAPAPPPAAPAAPEPPPEEFHLRRIRWGMSPEEVRAAEPGDPVRASEQGLVYATTTHGMPCLLHYSFAGGRLVRARLSFSDPTGQHLPPLTVAQAQRRFLYLREQLRSRYGEPIEAKTPMPRDVSDLHRTAQRQEELAQQYDMEIAEVEQRLQKQRGLLEARFARWSNKAELVARGLAPYERDLRELRTWKQEALERAADSRKGIQQRQTADATRPLVATLTARWPYARELHDVELKLDYRYQAPRLDVRYEETQALPGIWPLREL